MGRLLALNTNFLATNKVIYDCISESICINKLL